MSISVKLGNVLGVILIMICMSFSTAFGNVNYIFDDFDTCLTTSNNFYGNKDKWEAYGAVITASLDDTIFHGDNGHSLKLDYDVTASGAAGGYWEHFTYYYPDLYNPVYDMSEFDEFHFWIRGGSSYTTKCYIEFVDKNWNRMLVEITRITDSWQERVVTNLQSYAGVDWTQMKQWALVLKDSHVDSKTGVLYIDDLSFVDNDVNIVSDMDFVELWQKRMFKFFWDCANPDNGLIRDRSTNRNLCSIASVGFGLTAICIAESRGWISYDEAYNRVLTTLNSFYDDGTPGDFCVEGTHGLFWHFVSMSDGTTYQEDGVSTIDSALFMAGVLACRKYFAGTEIETLATNIYTAAEWDWFLNNDNTISACWIPPEGTSWHPPSDIIRPSTDPDGGFIGGWGGYNEAMILYLLAIGSSTHHISASCWDAWASTYKYNWGAYYGYGLLTASSLFTHQYSHGWINFRNKKDAYTNYFQNSIYASLANRAYCLDKWYPGKDIWGMSSTDGPSGYKGGYGFPPEGSHNDGTIDPQVTIASIVFTPDESTSSVRYMYDNYKDNMWRIYGLTSGFNTYIKPDWFDNDYVGIDLGVATIMIENFRSELVWDTFMQNTEIVNAMNNVGFVDDYTKETAYYREAEDYNSTSGGSSIRKEGHSLAWSRHTLHYGSDSEDPADGVGDESVYDINLDWGSDNAKFAIRYSDDVAGNVIELYLNDALKGTFTTDDTGGWNDFAWDSEIINLGSVNAGPHTIKLRVATGGSWGVNLDVFKVYDEPQAKVSSWELF